MRRFTLVELMIVVAIISLLAAIAIPNFTEMQLRAKRGEAGSNLDGIWTALVAYQQSADRGTTNLDANWNPTGSLGKKAQPWETSGSWARWSTLGWRPDGQTRCRYLAGAYISGSTYLTAGAQCDVDGDDDEYQVSQTAWEHSPAASSFGWQCSVGGQTQQWIAEPSWHAHDPPCF